ncbi:hypothetical protein [Formosa sp. A9]|uniref:hypothetical protein n=1 Tax=Formosa sp. A9 TaxID=3442641 RepID=UPI003EBDF790
MTDNIFKDRFSKKNNNELEAIALNEEIYTDEARLTAVDILISRAHTNDTLLQIHKTLSSQQEKNKTIAQENNSKPFSTTQTDQLPVLHSKRLILMFSLFFSTIFGGALLMYNFKQTGHSKARSLVLLFCILYAFVPVALMSIFNIGTNISIVINVLGGFILTEYFWNSYLGKTFKYHKKDWVKPTLIALAIALPLALFVLYSGGLMPM